MKRKKWIALFCALALLTEGSLLLFYEWERPIGASGTASPSAREEEPGEEDFFYLLAAGVDRGGALCDAMILLSVCRNTGEIWGLQLPRDTYAAYSEGSYRKLNGAANALGGMEALCAFLSESLGIGVDRYLRLSSDALRRGVDALGGVEICLSEPMDYEDPAQGLSIHLPAGHQTLNGEMAEQFLRYRSGYAEGDLGRIDAQKQFLSALVQKVRGEMSLPDALRLAAGLLGEVETNLTLPDLTFLARTLLSEDPGKVTLTTAPGAEATAHQSGASYFVLSAPGMDELLTEHFGGREGGFDPKGVFLNERYGHFAEIYARYQSCRPYPVWDTES